MKYALLLLLSLAWGQAWATGPWYVCPDSINTATSTGTNYATDCLDGNADLANSWASINAGDTVYFCGDWLPADARITVADSGTAGNYITLSGNAAACGRTSNSTISREGLTGTNARAISASNTAATRQYIKIADMTIKNTSTAVLWDRSTTGANSDDTALWISGVNFENCGTGSGTDGDCIWKRGANLIIQDSTFNGCYEDCVWATTANVTITGTRFENISSGDAFGDAIQIVGTGLADTGDVVITDNYCDHRDNDVKYCILIGPTAGAGNSVTVTDNTLLGPVVKVAPTEAERFVALYVDSDVSSQVNILRNYISDGNNNIVLSASAGSAYTTRAKIVGNITVNASDRSIYLDSNIDNADVWHNVAINATEFGIYLGKAAATHNVNNNIMANSDVGLFYITAPTSRGYNNYVDNTTNVSANGVAGTTTTGDITTNPAFVGGTSPTDAAGFCLDANSELFGAGTYIGAYVLGYAGESLGNPPHIGARGSCMNRATSSARVPTGGL